KPSRQRPPHPHRRPRVQPDHAASVSRYDLGAARKRGLLRDETLGARVVFRVALNLGSRKFVMSQRRSAQLGEEMVHTGKCRGYDWLVSEAQISGLDDLVRRFHPGLFLCVTAFDSGPMRLGDDDISRGWSAKGDVMISPPLNESIDLPQTNMTNGTSFPMRHSLSLLRRSLSTTEASRWSRRRKSTRCCIPPAKSPIGSRHCRSGFGHSSNASIPRVTSRWATMISS